jgi:hypothetical protein
MNYTMIHTNTTCDEVQSYINLHLYNILKACHDADIEYFEGPTFAKIFTLLPDKILQREMGIGLINMTAKQVGFQLIKRIKRGDFKNRRSPI